MICSRFTSLVTNDYKTIATLAFATMSPCHGAALGAPSSFFQCIDYDSVVYAYDICAGMIEDDGRWSEHVAFERSDFLR